jgi:DNA modification methylase
MASKDFSPWGENPDDLDELTAEEREQYLKDIRLFNRESLDNAIEQGWRLIRLKLHHSVIQEKTGMSPSTAYRKMNLITDPLMEDPGWIKPNDWKPCSLILEVSHGNPELFAAIKDDKQLNNKLVTVKQIEQKVRAIRQKQFVEAQLKAKGITMMAPDPAFPLLDTVTCGNAFDLIPQLPKGSINLVITSPPYAGKRDDFFPSPSEEQYPDWLVWLMDLLWSVTTADASVLINIRTNLKDGRISPYVLRSRLAVLERTQWIEAEELIWLKPDGAPVGSVDRPRRNFEQILWYAKGPKPYVDLLACGNRECKRYGMQGRNRHNLYSPSTVMGDGQARISDVFLAMVCEIDKDPDHPAKFPPTLVDQLVRTFSRAGDTVLDPFVGSGTTSLVAKKLERHHIGFDMKQDFVDLSNARLADEYKYKPDKASLDSLFEEEGEDGADAD